MSIATGPLNITESYFSQISEDNHDDHFKLDREFLAKYESKKPKFGYNGLGELVFYRTYSRLKQDKTKETFTDLLCRVIEGCYEIQRRHCRKMHIPWDYDRALISAHEMFQRAWDFKFLPPGRGLWMMGTKFMWERGAAALNNCGFVSTRDIAAEPSEPFCFLMDMSMLGVGVGFDTRGADKLRVDRPANIRRTHVVADSREGWVDSLRVLIDSFTIDAELGCVDFDYDSIRPAGSDINGFGGKASGPGILIGLHRRVSAHLRSSIGRTLSSVDITELMNYIGCCVVAGNVRRTAEIAFGDADDIAYRQMKNPCAHLDKQHHAEFRRITGDLLDRYISEAGLEHFEGSGIPEEQLQLAIPVWNALASHRWASNNSLMARIGMSYDEAGDTIAINGEPGFIWLDNIRDYGRMIDGRNPGIDGRAMGTNPCCEQSLESYELCNLVETFPANHDDAEDYMRTLKFAYLYAKTVTLLPTHNARTNAVTLRNRRIGLSQSGIVQAFTKFGRRHMLSAFCDAGYNEIRRWDDVYSEWLCVQRSIKVTSVKPSGTVSLVVGATPGIHSPEASVYWRTVRIAKNSSLIKILTDAGYRIEPSVTDPNTMVAYFGVCEDRVQPVDQIGIWEQTVNAVDFQRYWADNQVSCTIKFKKGEASQIARVLEAFEDQLKGISFLPLEDHGYAQAPYIPCTKEEVLKYNTGLGETDYGAYLTEAVGSVYCDGEKCVKQ